MNNTGINDNHLSKEETPFDVDDIVKKIDAKIMELEKEEENNKSNNDTVNNKHDLNMNNIIQSPQAQEDNNKKLNEIINGGNKTIEKKNVEMDDDFFDDFYEE